VWTYRGNIFNTNRNEQLVTCPGFRRQLNKPRFNYYLVTTVLSKRTIFCLFPKQLISRSFFWTTLFWRQHLPHRRPEKQNIALNRLMEEGHQGWVGTQISSSGSNSESFWLRLENDLVHCTANQGLSVDQIVMQPFSWRLNLHSKNWSFYNVCKYKLNSAR